MGVTISITISDKLEKLLSEKAELLGISRSRQVNDVLIAWQNKQHNNPNLCISNNNGVCQIFGEDCTAVDQFAKDCPNYKQVGGVS